MSIADVFITCFIADKKNPNNNSNAEVILLGLVYMIFFLLNFIESCSAYYIKNMIRYCERAQHTLFKIIVSQQHTIHSNYTG